MRAFACSRMQSGFALCISKRGCVNVSDCVWHASKVRSKYHRNHTMQFARAAACDGEGAIPVEAQEHQSECYGIICPLHRVHTSLIIITQPICSWGLLDKLLLKNSIK